MKTKKVAIILVSASLAMGTVGTMTVFADPPAMSSEMPQAPNGETPQMPDAQNFNGEMPQAPGQDFNGDKPQVPGGEAS